MKYLLFCSAFLWASLLYLPAPALSAAAEKSVEELLDNINRLPSLERQKGLVEGAKKEGELVWYSTMNREHSSEFIREFEKEHPYIKIRLMNAGAVKTMARIVSEYRAKAYLFDITHIRGLFLSTLRSGGIIARYRSPAREFLRKDFVDREGYFNGLFTQGNLFVFNTKLVKKEDYPRSIEELLMPKWRGRLAMDAEGYDWLAALIDYYGQEKGRAIAEKLGRQNLSFRQGGTLLANLLVAGEFPMLIDGYNHISYGLKEKGAPIDYIFPEPYVPAKTPTPVWIAAHAPHPHAAALFVDFLLSKKVQEVMAHQGRWVSRRDVTYQVDPGSRTVQMVSPVKWGERNVELVELFNKLIYRKD